MSTEPSEFLKKLLKFVCAPPATDGRIDVNGNVYWFNSKKEVHKKIGPAIITAEGRKMWRLYGKPFRLLGPTLTTTKGGKAWLDEDGNYHRHWGPAVYLEQGGKFHFIHGKSRSELKIKTEHINGYEVTTDGPRKHWRRNGKLHREDGPAVEIFYQDAKMAGNNRKEWWIDDKLHRVDRPAIEYSSGREEWRINGVRHRDGGPAVYNGKGYETWWQHGMLHREGEPAKTASFGKTKKWFVNGRLHREDGPAREGPDGLKKWYRDGDLHREDGPAVEYSNGDKEWWVKGRPHREDGPAIDRSSLKAWYISGRLHREDGPAIEHRYGEKVEEVEREWWSHGRLHRKDGPAIEVGAVPEALLKRAKEASEKYDASNSPMSHKRFTYGRHRHMKVRSYIEAYYGDKAWWIEGKLHREDGPAIERLDGTKKWYRWGNLHREDGPAVEHPAGSKEWWFKGRLHRKNGPAVEVLEGHIIVNMNYKKPHQDKHNVHYRMQAQEWLANPPLAYPPKYKEDYMQTHIGREWWVKGKQLSEEEWKQATTR